MGRVKNRGGFKTRRSGRLTGIGPKGVSLPASPAAQAVLEQRLAEAGRRVAFGAWTSIGCEVRVDDAAIGQLRMRPDGGYWLEFVDDAISLGRHSSAERAQAKVRRGIAAAMESGAWAVEDAGPEEVSDGA